MTDKKKSNGADAPFGGPSRQRLISTFLESADPNLSLPRWQLIYRLLLWVDQTTGLAHSYESDKCQPGKPWYPRSLRFHDWLSTALGVHPADAHAELDWLFKRAVEELATVIVRRQQALLQRAEKQRAPFEGRGFPEPGGDPAIIEIIRETLGPRLLEEPTAEEWMKLSQRIRESIAVENKRKNLLGEGFEDVLAAVLTRSRVGGHMNVTARQPLHLIPGFANQKTGDKANKVDLSVVSKADEHVSLVTAKWSIRADREKQFPAEFSAYVQARSGFKPFDYVLVTNEFDPARLMRACESMGTNSWLFSVVVHINCDALRAVYETGPKEGSMQKVIDFIACGRLVSIDDWMDRLATASARGH